MMKTPQPATARTGSGSVAGEPSLLNAVVDDQPQRPSLPHPEQNMPTDDQLRLEDAKRLARENPAAVANIIKGWVNGEGELAET
jgi:flagellar M-ring protein FliF